MGEYAKHSWESYTCKHLYFAVLQLKLRILSQTETKHFTILVSRQNSLLFTSSTNLGLTFLKWTSDMSEILLHVQEKNFAKLSVTHLFTSELIKKHWQKNKRLFEPRCLKMPSNHVRRGRLHMARSRLFNTSNLSKILLYLWQKYDKKGTVISPVLFQHLTAIVLFGTRAQEGQNLGARIF